MKKTLLILAIFVAAVTAVLLLAGRRDEDAPVREARVTQSVDTGPGSAKQTDEDFFGDEILSPPGTRSGRTDDSHGEETIVQEGFQGVALPESPHEPLAMVNDLPITAYDLFPPEVLEPGEVLPEQAYRAYLDQAIERKVLLDEARRLGMADTGTYRETIAEMEEDLQVLHNLNEEQRQWRLKHFSETVLVDSLYKAEGLIPRRVTKEEIEEYYGEHGDEYEWLRERERRKGSDPDKIEKRVRDMIKKDIKEPISRDMREKRSAFADSLRQKANIEILR